MSQYFPPYNNSSKNIKVELNIKQRKMMLKILLMLMLVVMQPKLM